MLSQLTQEDTRRSSMCLEYVSTRVIVAAEAGSIHISSASAACSSRPTGRLVLRRRRAGRVGVAATAVPAPGNIYATPLRFKLGGRPVLSARFNVETAGSERKRPEI